jgi:hypothetical protein
MVVRDPERSVFPFVPTRPEAEDQPPEMASTVAACLARRRRGPLPSERLLRMRRPQFDENEVRTEPESSRLLFIDGARL